MEALSFRSFKAILWNASGQFSTQIISFAIGIILARLLSPAEYGLIALAIVFNGISGVFIDGGFAAALIRKKNPTENDLSTVFYFNNGMAVLMYILIFLLAPAIAEFFNQPNIILIIRILSLNFILASIGNVHSIILIKKLDYKTQSIYRILSVLISGIIGIVLAMKGFGVWSLVTQSLLQNAIWVLMLWMKNFWYPIAVFSINSFKELFSFGSKLMASSFLYQIFSQSYSVIIGKFFPLSQLGYYNRADSYQKMTSLTLTNMVNSIVFPALTSLQDDDKRLKDGYRRIIKMTMLINVPMMIGFILVAQPLILFMITDKWLPAVPLLQWLCVAGLFFPMHVIIMNILNVKGRSDVYLYLVILKESLIVFAIVIGYHWGVFGLVIGQVIVSFIAYLFIGYFAGRFIRYTIFQQLYDIIPFFFLSIVMFGFGYFAGFLITNLLLKIFIQFSVCIVTYLGMTKVFKLSTMIEMTNLIKELFHRKDIEII